MLLGARWGDFSSFQIDLFCAKIGGGSPNVKAYRREINKEPNASALRDFWTILGIDLKASPSSPLPQPLGNFSGTFAELVRNPSPTPAGILRKA